MTFSAIYSLVGCGTSLAGWLVECGGKFRAIDILSDICGDRALPCPALAAATFNEWYKIEDCSKTC
ncbi:hypothetical protein [Oscillatoria nigro-viridis]|uniref:hypothetical protein n=1 Tax=Phormidium nigroviride TaxID=482564 RepID=UPI0002FF7258|nr:hypothetical protein [Oscillatoria nigro-viridis]